MIQKKERLVVVMFSFMWLFPAMFTKINSQGKGTTITSTEPVLDIEGNPVVPGSYYYIKPAIPNSGSALTFVTRSWGEACPQYVGQLKNPDLIGTPVNFITIGKTQDTIKEDENVMIIFEASVSCNEPPHWSKGEVSNTRRQLINTGYGDRERNLFRIVNNNGLYYITRCYNNENNYGVIQCDRAAGIMSENGVRLLALDGIELPFVFEKVVK